jgi:hypothetical protein
LDVYGVHNFKEMFYAFNPEKRRTWRRGVYRIVTAWAGTYPAADVYDVAKHAYRPSLKYESSQGQWEYYFNVGDWDKSWWFPSLKSWDVSYARNMHGMFRFMAETGSRTYYDGGQYDAHGRWTHEMKTLPRTDVFLDIGGWDVGRVTDMGYSKCLSSTNVDLCAQPVTHFLTHTFIVVCFVQCFTKILDLKIATSITGTSAA